MSGPTRDPIADLIDQRPFSRRTYVRTPGVVSGSITAWHVRQFVKALDAAEIPDSAIIQERKAHDTAALIELSAHREDVQ